MVKSTACGNWLPWFKTWSYHFVGLLCWASPPLCSFPHLLIKVIVISFLWFLRRLLPPTCSVNVNYSYDNGYCQGGKKGFLLPSLYLFISSVGSLGRPFQKKRLSLETPPSVWRCPHHPPPHPLGLALKSCPKN